MKEIAKLAGVSIATVSKVINGKDGSISEATRKKILKIVEEQNYIPNQVAKGLKVKQTNTIGLIIPDVMNLFFSELAKGVEDAADKLGYSVVLCNTNNDLEKEKHYLRMLKGRMIDGVIMSAVESTHSTIENYNQPLVLIDRDINTKQKVGRIKIDNEKGVFDSTNYLIQKGCKNIAFISSKRVNSIANDRFKGYIKCLEDNNICVNEDNIYLDDFSVDTGYKGIKEILNTQKIDGVVCGNDLIGIGVVKGVKETSLKIPQDIKIIGFDDIFISSYMDPPLTTIKQPIYEIGRESVDLLVKLIEKKNTDYLRILNHELIIREST